MNWEGTGELLGGLEALELCGAGELGTLLVLGRNQRELGGNWEFLGIMETVKLY